MSLNRLYYGSWLLAFEWVSEWTKLVEEPVLPANAYIFISISGREKLTAGCSIDLDMAVECLKHNIQGSKTLRFRLQEHGRSGFLRVVGFLVDAFYFFHELSGEIKRAIYVRRVRFAATSSSCSRGCQLDAFDLGLIIELECNPWHKFSAQKTRTGKGPKQGAVFVSLSCSRLYRLICWHLFICIQCLLFSAK